MTGVKKFDNTSQLLSNTCETHEGESIEFFCKDHEKLCCKTCVTSMHNSCDERLPLTAAAQDNGHRPLPHKTIHEIDLLKTNIEKHAINKSADRQRLDTEFEHSKRRVTECRARLINEIDRLQRDFENELQLRYEKDVNSIEKDITASEEMTEELNQVIRKLHSSEDNKINSFIGSIRAKELVTNFHEKLGNLSHDGWKKSLVYKVDPSIEHTFKDKKSFGSFASRNDKEFLQVKDEGSTVQNPCNDVKERKYCENANCENIGGHAYEIEENADKLKQSGNCPEINKDNRCQKQILDMSCNVMTESEREETTDKGTKTEDTNGRRIYRHAGIIEGMALTESGQLILSDSFNKSLQVSHIKEPKAVQTIPLKGRPRDVCVINEGNICISYKESHEVHLTSLKDSHTDIIHVLKIGMVCMGVFYKHGKLFVTCGQGSKAEVRLYLIDESLTNVRFCCKYPRGKKLFSSPCCVNTSNDGHEIYVGDYQEGIKALQRDGTLIWGNNDGRILKGVWGMAVDEKGNIYVTGHRTNNVVKISADGTTCSIVVDSLERPTAICYDEMTRTLLIVYDTNQLLLHKLVKSRK